MKRINKNRLIQVLSDSHLREMPPVSLSNEETEPSASFQRKMKSVFRKNRMRHRCRKLGKICAMFFLALLSTSVLTLSFSSTARAELARWFKEKLGNDKEFVNTEVNTGTAETFVESSRQEIDLKAALAMFPIIVKGYCCGIEEDGMKRCSISESYRGGLQGIVSVRFVDFQPKMEQEYLLFAEPFANVMSDKDYLLAGDIVWEEDETSKSFVISAATTSRADR